MAHFEERCASRNSRTGESATAGDQSDKHPARRMTLHAIANAIDIDDPAPAGNGVLPGRKLSFRSGLAIFAG
jgi:hypothetical protein